MSCILTGESILANGKLQCFRLIFAILGHVKAKKNILSIGKTTDLHVAAVILHLQYIIYAYWKVFIYNI